MLVLPYAVALLSPEMSILIQKRPCYSGNLNSETPGDSTNTYLHWEDVVGITQSMVVLVLLT
jgi:hypothetical protein